MQTRGDKHTHTPFIPGLFCVHTDVTKTRALYLGGRIMLIIQGYTRILGLFRFFCLHALMFKTNITLIFCIAAPAVFTLHLKHFALPPGVTGSSAAPPADHGKVECTIHEILMEYIRHLTWRISATWGNRVYLSPAYVQSQYFPPVCCRCDHLSVIIILNKIQHPFPKCTVVVQPSSSSWNRLPSLWSRSCSEAVVLFQPTPQICQQLFCTRPPAQHLYTQTLQAAPPGVRMRVWVVQA